MDDKRAIEIEKTERGVAWTDADGKRNEYERPIRTLWINVLNLRATCSLRKDQASPVQTSLVGTALIEDYGIQVIGYPATKSKLVDLGFHPYSTHEAERIAADSQEPFTKVSVGYSTSDWELGNKSGWYCSVYLPEDQLQQVMQAYHAGDISSMVLGVSFSKNAYVTSGDSFAPPSCKVEWYLPPSSGSDPESVFAGGELFFINYHAPELNLMPVPIADADDEAPIFQPPPDPLMARLDATLAQLVAICGSLKFIGWSVVVLAAVIAFK